MKEVKEMIGGCCVCSDESGYNENPLVYCDGPSCNVAVHQACYGIVSVPAGQWFCEKCKVASSLRTTVKCELCPLRDGALKPTDTGKWSHVVCALYIPEVRFGNVSTMEPVMLQHIPDDRFHRLCYLCEKRGEPAKATEGACMTCNKPNCKYSFHVTCAQQEGLLCEENGNYDNIKYCGYCDIHMKRIRKDPTVKVIPPFKLARQEANNSDTTTSHTPNSNSVNKRKPSKSDDQALRPGGESPVVTNNNHKHPPLIPPLNHNGPASLSRSSSNCSLNENPLVPQVPLRRDLDQPPPSRSKSNTPVNNSNSINAVVSSVAALQMPSSSPNTNAFFFNSAVQSAPTALVNSIVAGGVSQQSAAPQQQIMKVRHAGPGRPRIHAPGTVRRRPPDSPLKSPGLIKRQRRSSAKRTVKSLLEQVSPVVADTVSSFHTERTAANHGPMNFADVKPPVQQMATLGQTLSTSASAPTPTQRVPPALVPLQTQHPDGASGAMQLPSTSSGAGGINFSAASVLLPSASSLADFTTSNAIGAGTWVSPPNPFIKANTGPDAHGLPFPTTLEQLLERQWEQGSQFMMEQAGHFDIASLLSCLHQLKQENVRLETNVTTLGTRRDHLLAVNARLSLPLSATVSPQASPRLVSAAYAAAAAEAAAAELNSSTGSSRGMRSPSYHSPTVTTVSPTGVHAAKAAYQTSATCSSMSPRTTVASAGYPIIGSGGVFTSVKQKAQADGPSPTASATGFAVPHTPGPIGTSTAGSAADFARSQAQAAVAQLGLGYSLQDPMMYHLMHQQALALYGMPGAGESNRERQQK